MKRYRPHRAAVLLAGLALAAGVQQAPAEDYKGYAWAFETGIEDKEILLDATPHFYTFWRVYVMMGEAVEYYQTAWLLPDRVRVRMTPPFLKRYRIPSGSELWVPRAVLERIRVTDLYFHAPVGAAYGNFGLWMDPGILLKPYIAATARPGVPDYTAFQRLGEEARRPYWSFNSPGSPDWGDLFRNDNGDKPGYPAQFARQLMKAGFSVSGPWEGNDAVRRVFVRRLRYDLSAVKEWLLGLDRRAIEEWKREVGERESALAARDAERKKAEEKDFWNTPASGDSVQDRQEREAVTREKGGIAAAEQSLARELRAVNEQRAAFDAALTARRREIEGRPRPGEGLRGRLAGEVPLPAGWEFGGCAPQGGGAVQITRGGRAFIRSPQSGKSSFISLASGQKSGLEWSGTWWSTPCERLLLQVEEKTFGFLDLETGRQWTMPRLHKQEILVAPNGREYVTLFQWGTKGDPTRQVVRGEFDKPDSTHSIKDLWPEKAFPEIRGRASPDFRQVVLRLSDLVTGGGGSVYDYRHFVLALPDLKQVHFESQDNTPYWKAKSYQWAGPARLFTVEPRTETSQTMTVLSLPGMDRTASITAPLGALQFSADGASLFVLSAEGQLVRYETGSGREARRYGEGGQAAFPIPADREPSECSISLSPDGRYAAAWCQVRKKKAWPPDELYLGLKVWEVKDGRLAFSSRDRRFGCWIEEGRSFTVTGSRDSKPFVEVYR